MTKENGDAAALFINSTVWTELRKIAMERRPPAASATDSAEVAAAKGHRRSAWEEALDMLQIIPFEAAPDATDPFNRPAITETAD